MNNYLLADEMAQWPREQHMAYGRAMLGMANGTLAPLAEYIRAGYPVAGVMALDLAAMIDGKWSADMAYEITVKGRDGNKKGFSDRFAVHKERVRIGLFINRRVERGQTVKDAAGQAAGYFSCEYKKAEAAKYYLDAMERGEAKGFAAVDPWGSIDSVSEEFPDE